MFGCLSLALLAQDRKGYVVRILGKLRGAMHTCSQHSGAVQTIKSECATGAALQKYALAIYKVFG